LIAAERLHPALLASTYGIPVFSLASDFKMRTWSSHFGWDENFSAIEALTEKNVSRSISLDKAKEQVEILTKEMRILIKKALG